MNEFYIYGYFYPNSRIPFYIGKGFKDRMYSHLAEAQRENTEKCNKHKLNTIRKILKNGEVPDIRVLDSGLDEETAFEFEMFLISEIGRKDLGTGPLTNMTAGGEGLRGLNRDLSGENNPNYGKRGEDAVWWGRKHSDETKQKMSLNQKGKTISESHKQAMRKPKSEAGRKAIAEARKTSTYRPSEETKHKISETLKGRPSPLQGRTQSSEARQKMSEQRKGKPSARKGRTFNLSDEAKESLRRALSERNSTVVECPHCKKTGSYVSMIRWHMNNCKENKDAC